MHFKWNATIKTTPWRYLKNIPFINCL
jgi:hypothetical protein